MNFDPTVCDLSPGRILIEAGAGTGKTWTLTTLCLRLVAECGVPINRILMSTFTDAATRELRTRVHRRIADAARALAQPTPVQNEDPCVTKWRNTRDASEMAQFRSRLIEAVAQFDQAAISTFHGLCGRFLRELAFEMGVPLGTKLSEDITPVVLSIIEDYLAATMEDRSDASLWRARVLAARRITPESLLKLWNVRANAPKDVRIMPQFRWAHSVGSTNCIGNLLQAFATEWLSLKEADRQRLAKGAKCESPDESCFQNTPSTALQLALALQKEISTTKRPKPPESLVAAANNLHDACRCTLLEFQIEFLEHISRTLPVRLKAESLASFNSLISLVAHAAKHGTDEVRQSLASRFDAILVDEFQDTDPEQFDIIECLASQDTTLLVLVGDPKQAIYGFRNANVHTYLRVRDQLRADASDRNREGSLLTSYRSIKAFVDGCNLLFSGENPFLTEAIKFDPFEASERAERQAHGLPNDGRPAIFFRCLPEVPELNKGPAESRIAYDVAADIRERVNAGVKPASFAILVRKRYQGELVRDALARAGLPAVFRSDASVWETDEATQLANLLDAFLETGSTRKLKTALLGSWFDHTAREVARLDDSQEDLSRWSDICASCRTAWIRHGVTAALSEFDRSCDLRSRILSRPNGDRSLTNLDHLTELLDAAARRLGLAPAALLRWMRKRMSGDEEDRNAALLRMERDDEAVQVMTMHGSKGLEFRHVYLPFTWGAPLGIKSPCIVRSPDGTTTLWLAKPDDSQAEIESEAEERRLFYVGVTRARLSCTLHVATGKLSKKSVLAGILASLVRTGVAPHEAIRELEQGQGKGLIQVVQLDPDREENPDKTAPEPQPILRAPPPEREPEPMPALPKLRPAAFSFSSLHRDTAHLAEAQPDPELADEEDTPAIPKDEDPDGLHALRAGAATGDFVHALLEHHDFTQPESLGQLLHALAVRHGIPANHLPALTSCVHTLGSTELPGPEPFRLDQIPARDRWNEVEFLTRGQRPSGNDLAECFRSAGGGLSFGSIPDRLASLRDGIPADFLTGSIDAVVRHSGRYHIIDWKSNRIGPDGDAYHPIALDAAMEHALYPLQAALYALALHRQLSLRLDGYSPEKHLGGIHYVFLRGIDKSAPGRGIFHREIPVELVLKLDALLACAKGGDA
jgi:exodeoxyribonuclease V beta subunit